MIFVVICEVTPGSYELVATPDVATISAALEQAAAQYAQSDVFYAAALGDFAREQVAARRTVIDWLPPLA